MTKAERILNDLKEKYPGKYVWDYGNRGEHFVCEVEPTSEHPEYERTVEVIIHSLPHKHLKATQWYTIFSGEMELHVDDKVIILKPGDKYTINPGVVHWGVSEECWLEIYSKPGWNKEDNINC